MDFAHLALARDPHDRLGLRRTDDAWLDERWSDPARPGAGHLRHPGPPARRRSRVGCLGGGAGRRTHPARRPRRHHLVGGDRRCRARQGRAGPVVPAAGAVAVPERRSNEYGAARLPCARPGGVALGHPPLPAVRRPAHAARGRTRAAVRAVRQAAVPPDRPGSDHGRRGGGAGHATRSAACSGAGRIGRRGPVLDPRRVLRTGRDARGRGPARGRGGDGGRSSAR